MSVKEAKQAKEEVVPHAGTWIEIYYMQLFFFHIIVVPHAGTWIEMKIMDSGMNGRMSFPTRERGLKYAGRVWKSPGDTVVPHAGTWIEIGGQ